MSRKCDKSSDQDNHHCSETSDGKENARSKLPKKRRRVLPVEQPRRKREPLTSNRRVNAVKHGTPVVMKEMSPGSNKFGVNGMNMISLALPGPAALLRPPSTSLLPLQARAPIVEGPITSSAAISLASLQPPLITVPPLQPRPATTGVLDLMLPLQPKLLPGYNLQSSLLTNTLSTVRPPDTEREYLVVKDVVETIDEVERENDTAIEVKNVIIIEKRESVSSVLGKSEIELKTLSEVDDNINNECYVMNEIDFEMNSEKNNDDEINSNVIVATKSDVFFSSNDSSNNNSYEE